MERSELLRRVKVALRQAFGKRLQGVLLYGSGARGTAAMLDVPADESPHNRSL